MNEDSNNVGNITQVIGAVVDVKFDENAIPSIYNALETEVEIGDKKEKIILEVQQQLGGGIVRTVAMTSTDGVKRSA